MKTENNNIEIIEVPHVSRELVLQIPTGESRTFKLPTRRKVSNARNIAWCSSAYTEDERAYRTKADLKNCLITITANKREE